MAAENIGSLVVRVEAQIRDFQSNMDRVENRIDNAGRGLKKFAGVIAGAFAVGAVVNFGKQLITTASDAAEMQSKFDTVFSTMSKDAEAWATDFQDRIGGSRVEIKGMIADSQDMLTGFGATTEEAFGLSTKFQELGSDLASFTNLQGGAAEGVDRVRKGLLGEHENLKALGIVINETVLAQELASRGDTRKLKDLSELEKIELRYAVAVSQSKNAIGDAEKTSKGFANQVRNLKGRMTDLTAELGEALLPAATTVVTFLVDSIPKVRKFVTDAFIAIKDAFSGTGDTFSDVGPLIMGVLNDIMDLARLLLKVFKSVWPDIKRIVFNSIELIVGVIKGLLKILSGLIDFIVGIFTGDWKRAWKGIEQIFDGIFNDIVKSALKFGKEIVNGLIQGINSMFSAAKRAATNLAAGVKDGIKNLLGISSPSKLMDKFGQMVSEGLAQGIEKRANRVKEEAEKLVDIIKNTSETMIDKLGSAMDIVSKEFKLMELRLKVTTSNSERLEEAKKTLAKELGLTENEISDLTEAYGDDIDKLLDLGLESKKVRLEKQELVKQLTTAQQKADVLTEAYGRMVKAQGENSLAAMELKNQLLDVQIAAAEYSNQLVEANEKIAESAKSVYEEYTQMGEEVDRTTSKTSKGTSKTISKKGWRYLDKYGIEHVVSDKATAEKYGQEGTIKKYTGSYAGGYAFADGGVINRPTAALLGETFKARPEIISPVKLLENTFKDVLNKFASRQGMGGDIIIHNMSVRSDNDVKMIAREIFLLQQSKARASGVIYG